MDRMICFNKENAPANEQVREIYSLMEKSFPSCERHTGEKFARQFSRSEFSSLCLYSDRLSAFINYWDFGDFVYIEHFAVQPELRGNGVGAALIREALSRNGGKTVVLEAEPRSLGEIAVRRLGFYARIGFVENAFDYVQPSMQQGEPPVPLVILSYPEKLTLPQYEHIRDTLYSEVYG